MGIHNALSTIVGLAAVMYRHDPLNSFVVTLRSSDDSMTLYLSDKSENIGHVVEFERKCLKLLGINLSAAKTIIFNKGYGEFTSWYQDGPFISQYGVETSTIRPQGRTQWMTSIALPKEHPSPNNAVK